MDNSLAYIGTGQGHYKEHDAHIRDRQRQVHVTDVAHIIYDSRQMYTISKAISSPQKEKNSPFYNYRSKV